MQFDAKEVLACAQKFDFSWLDFKILEKIMLEQVAAIRHYQAAIVIGDVAPTLKIAAEITGIQHVSLMNGYMTRYYARTRKISRSHKAYWLIKKLPEALADSMTRLGEQLMFKNIQRPFNKIREKYNLAACSDYLEELEGQKNLICDLPTLFPQKSLPPSFKIIGPLIYRQPEGEHTHFLTPSRSKPVICICMGSSGNWTKLNFLNGDYYSRYTIVTAGDVQHVLSAPHIIHRDFVDLNQLLASCSLMICHGGNGTIYTGILNHVYMLCLSNHFEQEWNIDALEEHGFGLSADGFDEANWKAQIDACCTYSDTRLESNLLPF